jgi:putative tricarboxylic transport membrane protein
MNVELGTTKDFWAGALLIATGGVAIFIARDYTFGNALRMGPGYFPIVLGAVLILFGLYLLATGLAGGEKMEALFGVLIERAGFAPAMMVLIFGSATASTEFRFVEVLLFSIGLTALCAAVFIYGLGLPYPLIADF